MGRLNAWAGIASTSPTSGGNGRPRSNRSTATNPEQSRRPHNWLSHKHPDDYEYIAATLDDIRQSHRPFSTRHRIITVQGDTRDIVGIGERLHDNSGEVIGTHGFYIDVTRSDKARDATISGAVADFAEHRAAIEEAKGVLMYVYRIDSEAAFDLLKWRSQETNTKLRTLAEQLLADVRTSKQDDLCPDRATFDQLLLTAHQRAEAKAAHDPEPRHNRLDTVQDQLVQTTTGKWITQPRCPNGTASGREKRRT